MPSPYSQAQEIYLTFQGAGNHLSVENGIWTLRLTPGRLISGSFDLWLPGGNAVGSQTRFFSPAADTTLTVPSTARSAITVGAYDPASPPMPASPAAAIPVFSTKLNLISPPRVSISQLPVPAAAMLPSPAPRLPRLFVSGSAALMMEWGILRGNDPFLYGEKLKAYLIAGAKPIASESEYPNRRVGWGRLCLESSLPD